MDIDIFQLPGVLKRRWHYVVLTALLCLGLAVVFLATQKSYYRSTAEILLDPSRGGASGGNPGEAQVSTQQTVGSQIYVLQSREMLRDVVRNLKLTDDPYLAASGGGLRQRLFGGGSPAASGDRTDAVVDALAKNLSVEQAGDSLVLSITMKHRDSEMAAKIANAVAETYLNSSDQSQTDAEQRANTALQAQTETLRRRLLDALAEAEKFRTENGLITAGQQGLMTDQQLAGLNQQLLTARQAAEQQKAIADQANQLNISNVETGAIAEALQSPILIDLRSRYAQLLDKQAEVATSLGAEHPQMRAVHSQIASMRTSIENELDRIRKTAQANADRARANLNSLQTRFDALAEMNSEKGEARIKLAQLENEAASINAVYQSFLTRSEDLVSRQNIGKGSSRIISTAIASPRPVQAPKGLVLIAALLFGTAAGSVLAVLRDAISGAVRSERELVATTGVPVLRTVARLVDSGKPGWRQRLTRVFRLRRAGDPPIELEGQQIPEMGLARVNHLIGLRRSDGLPTVVVVAAADPTMVSEHAAPGIARQLYGLGEDVYLFNGTLRSETRVRRPNGHSEHAGRHPLKDALLYERVGDNAKRSSALLSLASDLEHSGKVSAFFVVDACGTEAQELLPVLLKFADGIILQSEIGSTHKNDLALLINEIEPWREKLIGNIVVGKPHDR
ncbi:GumC family protein [Mesorhizobium sp. NPDC059054]|uniref:GumC family protein n=1 Tax=Mesorhizobium sp. NPDC059054 TaxID=3346711 RepID=UPI00369F1CE2